MNYPCHVTVLSVPVMNYPCHVTVLSVPGMNYPCHVTVLSVPGKNYPCHVTVLSVPEVRVLHCRLLLLLQLQVFPAATMLYLMQPAPPSLPPSWQLQPLEDVIPATGTDLSTRRNIAQIKLAHNLTWILSLWCFSWTKIIVTNLSYCFVWGWMKEHLIVKL